MIETQSISPQAPQIIQYVAAMHMQILVTNDVQLRTAELHDILNQRSLVFQSAIR